VSNATALEERPGFWAQVGNPLRAIPDNPFRFIDWCLLALILGGISVWLEPILRASSDANSPWYHPWYQSLLTGNVAGFCVVLLAQMIPYDLPYSFSRLSGQPPEPARGTATLLALVLVVIQAICLTMLAVGGRAGRIMIAAQMVLFLLCMFMAVYLVCFRLRDLAPSVAVVEERENAEVKKLDTGADSVTKTTDGVQL
jgi:hypothetical protein